MPFLKKKDLAAAKTLLSKLDSQTVCRILVEKERDQGVCWKKRLRKILSQKGTGTLRLFKSEEAAGAVLERLVHEGGVTEAAPARSRCARLPRIVRW